MRAIRAVIAALACLLTAQAFAGTGALDPAFSGDGRQLTNFPLASFSPQGAAAVAIQPDGKIVVAGTGVDAAGKLFAVARFNANGTADTSFGTAGATVVPFFGTSEAAHALALQADGKIVVAGSEFSVARLNANGSLDATFNGTGLAVQPSGGQTAYAVAVQSDGKILAAGKGSGGAAMIARYNTNGTLDASFNGTGISTPGVPRLTVIRSLAIQPDGKVIVAGFDDYSGGSRDFAVARLTTNGGLDGAWNSTGYTLTDFAGANDEALAVAIQADGKVVVGGSATIAASPTFALARYTTGGVPDATFNGSGKVSGLPSDTGAARAIALQLDGKIVAAGFVDNFSFRFYAIVRYTAGGAFDTTFDGDGMLWTSVGPPGEANAVAIQSDGKIVAAGWRGSGVDFVVTRNGTGGAPDATFNASGIAVRAMGFPDDHAHAIAVQSDAKIVTAGTSGGGLAISRLASAGARDSGFGRDGVLSRAVTHCAALTLCDAPLAALALQADGKIVAAGTYARPNSIFTAQQADAVVYRYDAGVLDPTFGGGDGIANVKTDEYTTAQALAIQGDGKIVVAGLSYRPPDPGYLAGTPPVFSLFRLDTQGALDTTLNATGKVTTAIGTSAGANAVAIQADGSIVAAGYSYNGSGQDFTVVRYTSTGTVAVIDTRDIGLGTDDVAYCVAIQPDGKILAGGKSGTSSVLARYTASGAIDASFASGGIFAAAGAPIRAVAVRPDGKILALTESWQLLRFLASGALDSSFGVAGRFTISGMGTGAIARALAVQADGRVVVAGTGSDGHGNDFALARVDLEAPEADSDADGIPDSVELAEGRNPLIKDNDVFSSARLFAMQQYRDFLGREGDSGGIGFWTNQINAGTTRGQVVESFFNSAEFQQTGAPIVRLYFAYFLRIPDYGGLTFWTNQYRTGNPLAAISNAFAQSAEFVSMYGSLDNGQFVNLIYNNVLGRPPDAGGFAFWKGQLDTGAMTRGRVMLEFSESGEYRNVSLNMVYVTMMYVGMLRRTPEQEGFDFWVIYKSQGNPGIALIDGFLASREYHGRFLP